MKTNRHPGEQEGRNCINMHFCEYLCRFAWGGGAPSPVCLGAGSGAGSGVGSYVC